MGDALEVLNPKKQSIPGDAWYGFKFRTMDRTLHCIDGRWDLIIAHPPCTFMSNAGARWMYPRAGQIDATRYEKAMKAKRFFFEFYNADCERIAIENPTPMKCIDLPPPDTMHSAILFWSRV
jgi:hypothetical protein